VVTLLGYFVVLKKHLKMRNFKIRFDFRNSSYQASVTQIDPPPDKQWHLLIEDKVLTTEFGEIHIVQCDDKKEEYKFGIPANGEGFPFMSAMATSLRNYLYANGQ
jgi:hypothetical protein